MLNREKTTMRSLKVRALIGQILFWLALALILFFFLFPLYWMVVTSFKERNEVTLLPPTFIPFAQFRPTLINYLAVFTKISELGNASTGQANLGLSKFPEALFNSVLIGGTTTVVAVILGT